MNNNQGPDVIGLCEIENKYVLELIIAQLQISGRDYDIIHSDLSDSRGIDISFICDKRKYVYNSSEFFR